jgi:beta-lactamase class A
MKNGLADSVSVYMRDMNSGQWSGMNEDALYTPSSMLKVIAMMAALKLAEHDPTILSEKLHYYKSLPGSKDYFDSNDKAKIGTYTLQELIGYMIKYSDNDAFNAIVSDKKINASFVQAYSLFRLPPDALAGNAVDFMSPKSFASIFRVLYNSSFFEWNLSEQILDLLSQTTFTQGIVGGLPPGTLVAHKFGENTDELHDCGIVYYPGHPYLLCVMTRGKDIARLESIIQNVSRLSWEVAGQFNPQKK